MIIPSQHGLLVSSSRSSYSHPRVRAKVLDCSLNLVDNSLVDHRALRKTALIRHFLCIPDPVRRICHSRAQPPLGQHLIYEAFWITNGRWCLLEDPCSTLRCIWCSYSVKSDRFVPGRVSTGVDIFVANRLMVTRTL